jgi:hypothetical protein
MTHNFAGTDSGRQSIGLPGHCSDCAERGHVAAHPKYGCGDVGCSKRHGSDEAIDRDEAANALSAARTDR